jgi:hypothetical protein
MPISEGLYAAAVPISAKRAQPLPVQLLYLLIALGFVIYIPVALFRSVWFLLVLDALLLLAILTTVAADSTGRRAFGGNASVLMFVAMFAVAALPALAVDDAQAGLSSLLAMRRLFFGVGVLYVSSIWLNTDERVTTVVRIFVIGSVIAVVYGLRQLIFGLLPFELERLALMGSGADEIDRLQRVRIPSTFGDPATYSFVMMLGLLLYLYARERHVVPLITRKFHALALPLLVAGIGMTLTRAPMIGLALALMLLILTSGQLGLTLFFKWLAITGGVVAIMLGLDAVVSSGALSQSDLPWVRSINNVLSAVWTLIPAVFTGEVSGQLELLRSGSPTERLDAWREGLMFLSSHPFGGGPGSITENLNAQISFSPVDVGILRYALEMGWLGFVAQLGLWASVLVAAWRKRARSLDANTRLLGRYLISLWLAVAAAEAITSFFHTEMISVLVWSLGGIMLNLDRISNSRGWDFMSDYGGNVR